MPAPGSRPLRSEEAANTCRSAAARAGCGEEEQRVQRSSTQLIGLHLFSGRLQPPSQSRSMGVKSEASAICVPVKA